MPDESIATNDMTPSSSDAANSVVGGELPVPAGRTLLLRNPPQRLPTVNPSKADDDTVTPLPRRRVWPD